jgi:hypothetical protein
MVSSRRCLPLSLALWTPHRPRAAAWSVRDREEARTLSVHLFHGFEQEQGLSVITHDGQCRIPVMIIGQDFD